MKIVALAATLCLLCLPQAGFAKEKAAASTEAKAAGVPSAEESGAMAKAAREKSEALERLRDARVKRISKGICSGC